MRVVCSYCELLFDLKEPFEDDNTSHGICLECWPWVENNLKIEMSKQDRESLTILQAHDVSPVHPATEPEAGAVSEASSIKAT